MGRYFNLFNSKDLDRTEKTLYCICLLLVVGLLVFPFIFTRPAIHSWFDFTNTGGIGDTIGGLTSPFVGLIGAILIFISFRQQVKANRNLKNSEDKKYHFELFKKIDTMVSDKLLEFTIPRANIDRRNLLKYILSVQTNKKLETKKVKEYQDIAYSIKTFAFCISAYLILVKEWESERQFIKILEIKLRHYRSSPKLKSIETMLKKQLSLSLIFFTRHLNHAEKTKMFHILTHREKLDKYIRENEDNSNAVNLKHIKKIRGSFVYSFIQDLEQFDKL